ncbi:hypothetical protein NVS55_10700 [Myxococcus stipitatus]|uniref:hypothetical protein n=1 Tax=Myxococcus stipitatus TaxID=83455 RepID=UPI00314567CE
MRNVVRGLVVSALCVAQLGCGQEDLSQSQMDGNSPGDIESSSAALGANDVGVIAPASGCPGSYIWIHMDNEDSHQMTNVVPWVGATLVNASANLVFTFCRVDGNQFKSLATYSNTASNYAVLKLAATCPAGSVDFARVFDNEDTRNQNSSSGNSVIWPNYQDTYATTLRFCLFRGGSETAANLPALGFEYGVFAAPNFGFGSARGTIFSDDEDTRTKNEYHVDPAWAWEAKSMVSEGDNTTMYVARGGAVICGDGVCGGNAESELSCPADCSVCGNGTCGPRENTTTCIEDCGRCGDGYCSSRESSSSCPGDCGRCGDGICGPKETRTCLIDCPPPCDLNVSMPDGRIPTCPRPGE